MMKCVVLDAHTVNHGDLSWRELENLCEVTFYDRTRPEEVIERAKDADIILTNKVVFDEETLGKLPKLKYISVLATGYNIIDLEAAKNRGIAVSNVPEYSTYEVAEAVFAFILEICRRTAHHSDAVHAGKWSSSPDFCFWDFPLRSLQGKTLGIIGDGKIGKRVAKIAEAFEMKVLTCGRTLKDGRVTLDEVLKNSDFLSLHCPLTPDTKNLIRKENIEKMKDGAVLINTARGPVVNTSDLRDALISGKLSFAAVDVLEKEPASPDDPLTGLENCIVTPHIAWATVEARKRLIDETVLNVKAFIDGAARNTVNR